MSKKAKEFKFWFSQAMEAMKEFKENCSYDEENYEAERTFNRGFEILLDLEKQLQSNEIQIVYTETLKDVLEVQDFLESRNQ